MPPSSPPPPPPPLFVQCLAQFDDVAHIVVSLLSLRDIGHVRLTCRAAHNQIALPDEYALLRSLVGCRHIQFDVLWVYAAHLSYGPVAMKWIEGAIAVGNPHALIRAATDFTAHSSIIRGSMFSRLMTVVPPVPHSLCLAPTDVQNLRVLLGPPVRVHTRMCAAAMLCVSDDDDVGAAAFVRPSDAVHMISSSEFAGHAVCGLLCESRVLPDTIGPALRAISDGGLIALVVRVMTHGCDAVVRDAAADVIVHASYFEDLIQALEPCSSSIIDAVRTRTRSVSSKMLNVVALVSDSWMEWKVLLDADGAVPVLCTALRNDVGESGGGRSTIVAHRIENALCALANLCHAETPFREDYVDIAPEVCKLVYHWPWKRDAIEVLTSISKIGLITDPIASAIVVHGLDDTNVSEVRHSGAALTGIAMMVTRFICDVSSNPTTMRALLDAGALAVLVRRFSLLDASWRVTLTLIHKFLVAVPAEARDKSLECHLDVVVLKILNLPRQSSRHHILGVVELAAALVRNHPAMTEAMSTQDTVRPIVKCLNTLNVSDEPFASSIVAGHCIAILKAVAGAGADNCRMIVEAGGVGALAWHLDKERTAACLLRLCDGDGNRVAPHLVQHVDAIKRIIVASPEVGSMSSPRLAKTMRLFRFLCEREDIDAMRHADVIPALVEHMRGVSTCCIASTLLRMWRRSSRAPEIARATAAVLAASTTTWVTSCCCIVIGECVRYHSDVTYDLDDTTTDVLTSLIADHSSWPNGNKCPRPPCVYAAWSLTIATNHDRVLRCLVKKLEGLYCTDDNAARLNVLGAMALMTKHWSVPESDARWITDAMRLGDASVFLRLVAVS